eukprot:scaffold408_cov73-Isochrysis_galbana.AAC.1
MPPQTRSGEPTTKRERRVGRGAGGSTKINGSLGCGGCVHLVRCLLCLGAEFGGWKGWATLWGSHPVTVSSESKINSGVRTDVGVCAHSPPHGTATPGTRRGAGQGGWGLRRGAGQ